MKITRTIQGRRIRFLVVGCGRIAQRHFEALKVHHDRAELVGVCDADATALQRSVASQGVPGFASMDDAIAATSPDVVVLCTPSGIHARQTMRAAELGVNVVTEKPMATRWRDANDMVSACDSAGVFLFVVKQNRRNATLKLLKRACEQRRFGRIFMVAVNVFWNRPQAYYDSAPWRGTWEFDGGAFMNQASHYVDLLDWLIGPVESLHAFTGTLARDVQVEDSGVVNIKWRSGALGSMSVTMLTYPRNMEGSITIIGEAGTVRVGGVAVNQIERWEFASSTEDDARVKDASYETASVYGHGHPLYYENVLDALAGSALPETDGREGLRSLEILTGIYKSARDGVRVSLPLDY